MTEDNLQDRDCNNGENSDADSLSSKSSEMDAGEQRWDKLLRMKWQKKTFKNASAPIEFETMVRTIKFPDKVKVLLDVLQYWEEQKNETPELYAVAQIVFGTTGSQVSVERLFSLLNDLLSPRRYNLKACKIAKILFLKVNLDILLKLKRSFKRGKKTKPKM